MECRKFYLYCEAYIMFNANQSTDSLSKHSHQRNWTFLLSFYKKLQICFLGCELWLQCWFSRQIQQQSLSRFRNQYKQLPRSVLVTLLQTNARSRSIYSRFSIIHRYCNSCVIYFFTRNSPCKLL